MLVGERAELFSRAAAGLVAGFFAGFFAGVFVVVFAAVFAGLFSGFRTVCLAPREAEAYDRPANRQRDATHRVQRGLSVLRVLKQTRGLE